MVDYLSYLHFECIKYEDILGMDLEETFEAEDI